MAKHITLELFSPGQVIQPQVKGLSSSSISNSWVILEFWAESNLYSLLCNAFNC